MAANRSAPARAVDDVVRVQRMAWDQMLCYLVMVGVPLCCEFVYVLPVSAHMLITTVVIIYSASHASVTASNVDEDDEDAVPMERMETKDAMMFPVIGSIVLFSLYCVFKYLPKEWVNFVIKGYFCLFGVLVLSQRVRTLLAQLMPVSLVRSLECKSIRIPIPSFCQSGSSSSSSGDGSDSDDDQPRPTNVNDETVKLTMVDGFGVVIAAVFGFWYVRENHWIANNILGMTFSLQGIELLALGSFLNGAILLSGLFFYDIFWVFGTDVMVTVAKSFDAPIKLLFPRASLEDGTAQRPSMLGLGDIVIPGIFIALMLRYDVARHARRARQATAESIGRVTRSKTSATETAIVKVTDTFAFPRTFFLTNLFAYFLGLLTTVYVMYAFNAAQPALLYLVPACLGAALLTALCTGEVRDLVTFKEGDDDDKDGDDDDEDEGKKEK